MNLFKIVIYSALKKHFFDLLCNINCNAREYVAFTNVNRYFDIVKAERQELVDAGLGVKISRPVLVGRGLKGGRYMFSSVSHKGVLAVYCYASGDKYQLTDLVNKRQIEIEIEHWTHTGFYDNSMVVLTFGKPLRVCSVKEMFVGKNTGVLRKTGVNEVQPWADVSLLHSTRVLVFISKLCTPCEFNVDTNRIRGLDIGKGARCFASLTGVNIGVKGVFAENGNGCFTHSLNDDNSASIVLEHNPGTLCTFIASSSDPGNINMGMKVCEDGSFFTNTKDKVQLMNPFGYLGYQSIVRLYQDIFLVCNEDTKKWCLVKIIVQ